MQAVIGFKVCLTADIERSFLGAHSLGLGLSPFLSHNKREVRNLSEEIPEYRGTQIPDCKVKMEEIYTCDLQKLT